MAKHTKQHLMAALRTWIDHSCDEHGYVDDADIEPLFEAGVLARPQNDGDRNAESDDKADER